MKKTKIIIQKFKNKLINYSFTRIKVKTILIFSFLLIGIIPLVIVSYYTYQGASTAIEEKVGFYSREIVSQVVDKIDNKLNEIEKSSSMIISDVELINELAEEDYGGSYEEMVANNKLKEELNTITYSNDDLKGLVIFRENTKDLYSDIEESTVRDLLGEDFKESDFYRNALNQDGKSFWVSYYNGSSDNLYLMRKLTHVRTSRVIGLLVYIVEKDILNSIMEQAEFGNNSVVQLFNEKNEIIAAFREKTDNNEKQTDNSEKDSDENSDNEIQQESFTEKEKINSIEVVNNLEQENGYITNKNNLIAYDTTSNNWKLTSTIPVESLMGEIYAVGEKTIIVGIVCAIIALILGLFISNGISNPLKKIVDLMKKVENGDLTVNTDINGKNEIGFLASGFNKMINNIKNLIFTTREISDSVLKDTEIISDFSKQSFSSAQQVSESVETISIGAQEQADEAQSASEVMERLAERIVSVNENIKSVMEVANEIKMTSKQAGETVNDLNEKSNTTAEMSNRIMEDI
ncbi:MAG: methyl-accepting chemotaxis protein, partial [bacterium]